MNICEYSHNCPHICAYVHNIKEWQGMYIMHNSPSNCLLPWGHIKSKTRPAGTWYSVGCGLCVLVDVHCPHVTE